MKLAQKTINDVFGKISPPPGSSGLNNTDPVTGLSNLLTVSIRLAFVFAGVALLIYLMWGALDFIMAGGEKEHAQKAREKMTHAVVGILLMVVALTIFSVITGSILGIIDISGGGFVFELPHL